MCPNMHFGMLMEIEKEYNMDAVQRVLDQLSEAHPFLRSLITYEPGTERLYYNVTDSSKISLKIMNDEHRDIKSEPDNILKNDFSEISRKDWNVFENGLLKVYIYPEKQGMTVLFTAHHLLTDGRGLLGLAVEFANAYVSGTKPAHAEERLIESIYDLPEGSSLSGISRVLVKRANKQWEKENHIVSYKEYNNFVESYSKNHYIEYSTYEVDAAETAGMVKQCSENGVSINDLLMAHMYIKTGTKKIIIAADIRKTFKGYNTGAMGNYATACGIVCKTKTTDVIKKAREVHAAVQKHMSSNKNLMLVLACYFEINPTLLDAAAISALGGYNSKAGKFVGGSMFGFDSPKSYSITNLGKCDNENIKSLMFIPPASPAAKLTLGVVSLNGVMRACSSKNI